MRQRFHLFALVLVGLGLMVGCGNGSHPASSLSGSNSGGDRLLTLGTLTTRISGTVQDPVTTGGSGAVVTGVAGGIVSSLILSNPSPTLAGTQIAFESNRSGSYQIYVMNPDGSNLTRLTNDSSQDLSPAWSPDGSKILFESNRGGNTHIYVLNADGSQTQITKGTGADIAPAWSPDGSKIAFANNQSGTWQIYVINANGSGQPQQLTHGTSDSFSPSWSPDGSKIAYDANTGGYQIFTMNSDGSNPASFPNNGTSDESPVWSPDGSKLAFSSTRSGPWQVWVMNANGSSLTQLTTINGNAFVGNWAPDGSKITFESSQQNGGAQGYVMNADGSSQTQLTHDAFNDDTLAWSPFVRQHTLIGTGGSLGATAAGFLFARNGNVVTSVVAFNALTPDTARVSAQTGLTPGLPNVVFTVSADTLTQLSFINGILSQATAVIGPSGQTSTASGVLVDFNATTGSVSDILPYTASRAVGNTAPTVTMQNGVQVFRGRFTGVWDSSGQNHAANGASEVHIDGKTGTVLSVQ